MEVEDCDSMYNDRAEVPGQMPWFCTLDAGHLPPHGEMVTWTDETLGASYGAREFLRAMGLLQ